MYDENVVQKFSIDLEIYDIQAMRAVYEKFKNATIVEPALAGSYFLLEGYGVKGIQDVPAENTAFAQRGNNLLVRVYI